MNFENFEKLISIETAEINAKITDKAGNGEIKLSGRGIELMALSMQIAEDVMSRTHTHVDCYCEMLKEGINGKKDDSKTDEESKEESKTITKEDFQKAWSKTVDNLMHDKDLDGTQLLLSSLIFTKCANEMCESLFGEGLKNE